MIKHKWLFGGVAITANGFGLCVRWGLPALKLIWKTNFNDMTKVKLKNKSPNDAKPVLNDGFIIDFFELMFLAESVIPERPIARSMCFDDFSERHYNKMNDNQRLQFFEHVQKCHGFTLENEQCRHFFARFNPKNQYLVSCFHNGKAEAIQCYMFDEEYRTSKNRFVNRDYIKSVVRMHDSQTII